MTTPSVLLRWAGVVSGACLAALWVTYYLTNEPSVAVEVRWRDGLSAERRAELERRYLLVAQGYLADRTRYDLLDTRPSNIAGLVRDPDVAGTGDIDLETFIVPFEAEYGKSWVWAAHRVPVLRDADVRRAVIGGLAIMVLLAALAEVRRRR